MSNFQSNFVIIIRILHRCTLKHSRIKYDSVKTIVVEERERERNRESKKQKLPRQINLINRSRFMDASRSRKTRNNITDYLL